MNYYTQGAQVSSTLWSQSEGRQLRQNFQKILENLTKVFSWFFSFPLLVWTWEHFCFRNTNWVDRNVQQSFQIVRLSLADLVHNFLKLNMKEKSFLVILNKSFYKIQSNIKRQAQKSFFAEITQYKAIWRLFHEFCAQTAKWAWPIILGVIKTHQNFRFFKQAKRILNKRPYKKNILPLK